MFDGLELGYGLIVADPPWTFNNWGRDGDHKGAGSQYGLMSIDAIRAMPVRSIAAKDCIVLLWACNPMLDQALSVLEAWGATYKTAGHWVKRTRNGKLAFGTGYLFRGAGEPYLVGTFGKPKPTRSCRSIVDAPAREHSRKPDEAYAQWREWTPGVRRIELFSREARPGYDSWGNEKGKFDARANRPVPVCEARPGGGLSPDGMDDGRGSRADARPVGGADVAVRLP